MLAVLAEREKTHFAIALGLITLFSGILSFAMTGLMGWIGSVLGEERLWSIVLLPSLGFPLVGLGGLVWLARFGRQASSCRE